MRPRFGFGEIVRIIADVPDAGHSFIGKEGEVTSMTALYADGHRDYGVDVPGQRYAIVVAEAAIESTGRFSRRQDRRAYPIIGAATGDESAWRYPDTPLDGSEIVVRIVFDADLAVVAGDLGVLEDAMRAAFGENEITCPECRPHDADAGTSAVTLRMGAVRAHERFGRFLELIGSGWETHGEREEQWAIWAFSGERLHGMKHTQWIHAEVSR